MAIKWEKQLKNSQQRGDDLSRREASILDTRSLKRSVSSIYIPQNLKTLL